MPRTFLLLHSPLVGPSCWEPVAAELVERGDRALVPDLRAAQGDIEAMAALALIAEPAESAVTVVAHSGAGVVVPSVATSLATGRARAAEAGWPVRSVDAHHLALLTDPAMVAKEILGP